MKKFLDNIGKQGSKLQLKEAEVKFVVNDQDVTSKFLIRCLMMVNRYSRQSNNRTEHLFFQQLIVPTKFPNTYYGSTGCGVFKRGLQN